MKGLSLAFLIALSFLFQGCSTQTTNTLPKGQTLRLNFNASPITADPRKGGDAFSSTIQLMIFEGLTRMEPHTTTAFGLAKKIDISDDFKSYTFHLRKSKWSDGHPLTAYDFEVSWKAILSPKFPAVSADLLYPIKHAKKIKTGTLPIENLGVKALNDYTLSVTLEKPTPHFLEITSFCLCSPTPRHIIEKHPNWGKFPHTHFVTNGPFYIEKWEPNIGIMLKKNPHYWDAKSVNLEKIEISLVENENTAFQMYEKGELDFVGAPLSPIPTDAKVSLMNAGRLKTQPVASFSFCSFNTTRFPFNYTKLRKAFAYAINRKQLVDHITQSKEDVMTGCIPPVLKNFSNSLFFKDGNTQEAKKLFQESLKELELTSDYFNSCKITYTNSKMNASLVQAIQQQWKKSLGVEIQLQPISFKEFLNLLNKHDFDIIQLAWVAQYNNQISILELFKYKNSEKIFPKWENPEYIDYLNQSLIEKDPKKRFTLTEQAEKILMDEMPIIPLFSRTFPHLQKNHLKGVFISPIGLVQFRNAFIDHSSGGEKL